MGYIGLEINNVCGRRNVHARVHMPFLSDSLSFRMKQKASKYDQEVPQS